MRRLLNLTRFFLNGANSMRVRNPGLGVSLLRNASVLCGLSFAVGCGANPQDFVTTTETPSAKSDVAAGSPATTPPVVNAPGMTPPTETPSVPGTPAAPGTPSAPPENLVRAQAGVGAKGRSLDQHEGLIVTPAKTLFAARERAVFDILIPQALQLFKATNGQGPASHDEFMQKIVAENNIQLPQLPQGHAYQYDPQTEQLMVRK